MTDQKPTPVRIFPILLVNFIGTLGFSIVLPFLVTLVNGLGGNALVYGVMKATSSAFSSWAYPSSALGPTSMGGEESSRSVSSEL